MLVTMRTAGNGLTEVTGKLGDIVYAPPLGEYS